MICPNCKKELIYNTFLDLYYCKNEHFYFKINNRTTKLEKYEKHRG